MKHLSFVAYRALWTLLAVFLSVGHAALAWAAEGEGTNPGGGGGTSHTLRLFSKFCGGTVNGSGIQLFINYFNCMWPWLLSIAGGMAVLNGVIGGTMMMMSGGDSGLQSQGKQKLMYSIVGLLIVMLSGTILRTLNADFFK